MRFSRFKQHMEGVAPAPRKPRASVGHRQKKAKSEKRVDDEKKSKTELQSIKPDHTEMQVDTPGAAVMVKPECFVKEEAVDPIGVEELSLGGFASLAPADRMQSPLHMVKNDEPSMTDIEESSCLDDSWSLPASTIKREPTVKMEPRWGE